MNRAVQRENSVGCDIEAEAGHVNSSGTPGRRRTVSGIVMGV